MVGKSTIFLEKKWENSLKIDEYLFKPKFGRTAGFIQTSSFFGPRNLFIEIPFTEKLPKHQDWDWVLKARILGKINFIYLDEPLVIYHQDSVNSVGKVNNWKASFNWIKSWEDYIEKSSLNNFLISVPMSNVCFDPSLPLSTKRKIIKELKQFKFTLNSKYILILLKLYIFNIFYKKKQNILFRKKTMIKKFFRITKVLTLYIKNSIILKVSPPKFRILSKTDTLKKAIHEKKSIVRYGDGELLIIKGKEFDFQKNNLDLSEKLLEILKLNNDNILICLPEPLKSMENLILKSKIHWTNVIGENIKFYNKVIPTNRVYGNSFVSRPYLVFSDKKDAKICFDMFKQMWDEKNIILIEGEFSRTGVGNTLFDNAKSIKRILCPSTNAFDYYDDILNASIDIAKNQKDIIILIALGPTSKPLVVDLNKYGFWGVDIGHLDSEFEWFLISAKKRTIIPGKHTAELGDVDVLSFSDELYSSSIVARVGI